MVLLMKETIYIAQTIQDINKVAEILTKRGIKYKVQILARDGNWGAREILVEKRDAKTARILIQHL